MHKTDHFLKGSWNVECDRCGFKYKSYQLQKEWTGLMTCKGGGTNGCWEPRQPQDLVRGVEDKQSTPWSRPESDDSFLTTNEVTRDDL